MEVTRLLNSGQVIIPKALRDANRWEEEQELIAIDMGDDILIKSKKPFVETKLEDVAGCLKYQGKLKNMDELEDLITP